MATIAAVIDKATIGALLDEIFVRNVEQTPVAQWPIRARSQASKNVRNLFHVTEFTLPAGQDPLTCSSECQRLYKEAVKFYKQDPEPDLENYWAKMKQIPLPIKWPGDEDLKDSILQMTVRATSEPRKFQLVEETPTTIYFLASLFCFLGELISRMHMYGVCLVSIANASFSLELLRVGKTIRPKYMKIEAQRWMHVGVSHGCVFFEAPWHRCFDN